MDPCWAGGQDADAGLTGPSDDCGSLHAKDQVTVLNGYFVGTFPLHAATAIHEIPHFPLLEIRLY